MSFFKKLTAEIKELINDKDDKPKQDAAHKNELNRDYHATTQPYPQQPYGAPNQHGYSGPPPDQGQLPPGWVRQWDQNSQRWYFIEQASGRSQWDPPQPAYGGAPYQQYPPGQHMQSNTNYPPYGGAPVMHGHDKEHKKSGKGGMIAAGAGGLAVGALAGAALSGDSSDEEHGHTYAPAPAGYYGGTAPPPVPLEHNPELSSSQRSSLHEARTDYEEARREVAEDSDPSSSDIEELEEAREEYLSEVESAHEELED